jgi:hypothetical protein
MGWRAGASGELAGACPKTRRFDTLSSTLSRTLSNSAHFFPTKWIVGQALAKFLSRFRNSYD